MTVHELEEIQRLAILASLRAFLKYADKLSVRIHLIEN
jgi:hypothetical protein